MRSATLPSFRIDRTPVTNAAFTSFVEATGWITIAEIQGSHIFRQPGGLVDLADPGNW